MEQKLSSGDARPLIDWVTARFPDTPKKRAKQWITGGRVMVGGEICREPHRRLPDPGATLSFRDHGAAAVFEGHLGIHRQLTLRYADSAFAVVDKSAGLLSVPAPGARLSAISILRDFLDADSRNHLSRKIPPAIRALTPQPVHRLDQYSSGLLCIAMNAESRGFLIRMFGEHNVTREYMAFVDGKLPQPRGTWRTWLCLSPDGQTQNIVTAREANAARKKGMEAVTHYERVEEFLISKDKFITKVRFKLQTGARHQIRIQAAEAKVPIIGDRRYHPLYARVSEEPQPVPVEFPRQALHACRLGFAHPQNSKKMLWTADAPDDMKELEARIRSQIVTK